MRKHEHRHILASVASKSVSVRACKGMFQECLTNSYKLRALQESVTPDRLTRSHEVFQDCRTEVSHKSVPQDCTTRVGCRSFVQECHKRRVSSKGSPTIVTGVRSKSVVRSSSWGASQYPNHLCLTRQCKPRLLR